MTRLKNTEAKFALTLSMMALIPAAALAVPATAAADTAALSLSSSETTLGGKPVAATFSGTAESAENTHMLTVVKEWPEMAPCSHSFTAGKTVLEVDGEKLSSFSVGYEIPSSNYSALGVYRVCALVRKEAYEQGGTFAEATFTVLASLPVTLPLPVAAPVPRVATPPTSTPPVVTPVTKPESKLTEALKQCKKLKKHSKRVACEKRAKKKGGKR